MDVILCHETADFDALGAAVGAARLYPGARIVLSGGAHRTVQDFLALHRDAYPLLELRSVDERSLQRVILVDAQSPQRFGSASKWVYQEDVDVHVYDHHPNPRLPDYRTGLWCVEPVGATSTLMVERLQQAQLDLSPFEVTALALGIHVDTGSLTFGTSSPRDARALAWLMERGVNLDVLSTYIDRGLTPHNQELLARGLDAASNTSEDMSGYRVLVWVLQEESYIRGLSGIVERLMELTDLDMLVTIACQGKRTSLIGRSQHDFAQLQTIMNLYGGGGHARAASASTKVSQPQELETLAQDIRQLLRGRIPHPIVAAELMSSPVRTIRPDTTIDEAQRVLLRYGHSGLSVVNAQDELVGVVSRRDVDLALHHGFGHAPVKGYMSSPVYHIQPSTPLRDIQYLMLKRDIGRLPVLDGSNLIGIVTRTDVLRQMHNLSPTELPVIAVDRLQVKLQQMLSDRYWDILQEGAKAADSLGLDLYLVGGTVRDLLLDRPTDDLDLVVDGCHPTGREGPEPEGWGVHLAKQLLKVYPEARLEIHGKFQTAALIWPDGLWIDIATARTEFYPYPAALPEVSASSIQQDLYRRDFTINALALRLNGPQTGEVLDFFGGLEDLDHKTLQVLHPNSFVEDPTRTIRAVRFAVRLGFVLGDRTQDYALTASRLVKGQSVSGVAREQGPRLKQEFHYLLETPNWPQGLQLLDRLQALHYLHPDLTLTSTSICNLRRVGAWARRFSRQYSELHQRDIWQLRLECLLVQCDGAAAMAEYLDWPHEGLQRLQHVESWRQQLRAQLSPHSKPSEVARWGDRIPVAGVVLVGAKEDTWLRKHLWHYLTHWRQRKAPINGHDLKTLGYRPGPDFKRMLQALRDATLDGQLQSRDDAIAFLERAYSAPESL
ncbi:MAG: CBS domain-containing protein [Cyanobacteria bacterium P01_E01_bin.34]